MKDRKKSPQDTDNEEFDRMAADLITSTVPINWEVPVKQSQPQHLSVGMRSAEATKRIRQMTFLKTYAECGVVLDALQAAGINRSTERRWRMFDKWYQEQFRNSHRDFQDKLESRVRDIAMNGTQRPVIGRVQQEIGKDVDGNPIFGAVDAQLKDDQGNPLYSPIDHDLVLMFYTKKVSPEFREKFVAATDSESEDSQAFERITLKLEMIRSRAQGDTPALDDAAAKQIAEKIIDVVAESVTTESVKV